ncbi:MAG TPA: hypothetical protein VKG44_05320 [Candidatus Baltobacteraceae bacterium]|nr:hypothetical protein [Candidatus Baltobacteraceae bacterium]
MNSIFRDIFMAVSAVLLVASFGLVRGRVARRGLARPHEAAHLAMRMYLAQFLVPLFAIAFLWTLVVHAARANPVTLVAASAYTLFFGLFALGGLYRLIELPSTDPLERFAAIRKDRLSSMTPEQQRAEAEEHVRLHGDQ